MIYFLRHEERPDDVTFHTELTESGHKSSKFLSDKLKNLNITKIYCSPFLRTLQTIHPFTINSGLKVNVDYSLSELIKHDTIPKDLNKSFVIKNDFILPKNWYNIYNISKVYKSVTLIESLTYPENVTDITKRVNDFINKELIKNSKHDNILICTHLGIIQFIIPILFSTIDKDLDILKNYPMGQLSYFSNDKLCLI